MDSKYVIFSPRTADGLYNHHILVKAVSFLEDDLKKDIQIVITGYTGAGNRDYLNRLIEIGKENNVCMVNLDKFLTPQEMAEIYNISSINVNIPKHDQLARSIMEGCLCGCIPLLNVEIPAYHDLFKNEENCVFVEPEPEAVATKIEWILKNGDKLEEHFFCREH
ncbi:glycosyltransferase [Methanosarcina horonobensis]|uniref:glycosyltransferase n=1 Tax=Methanosarcina horonobensis TaxID=418008 RepID=UPI000B034DF4|nr:glycosyltransferase [Methanosarcina horonobensis]